MAKSENLEYIKFDVGVMHLELTSRCNLLCPMCGRTTGMDGDNIKLKKRDDLDLTDTDPRVIQQALEDMKPFLPNHVFINGNYGDPIMYPYLLEVVKMCKDMGVAQVTLSTNGSAQTEAWWIELASIMRKPDKVIFAIDGLEDTNHLYRVNSKWNIIMRNAKAFIASGGTARWDFIGFAHNEHQIDEARQLAEDMGFVKFRYKKSNRYVVPTHYEGEEVEAIETKKELTFVAKQHVAKNKKKIESKTADQKEKALATILAEPTKTKSNTTNKVDDVIKKHKGFDNYVKVTEIACQTKRDKSIFIDYQGKVWPCCWQGHYYSKIGHDMATPRRIEDNKNMWKRYGKDFNDLSKHSLFDILKTPYFANDLVASWETNSDDRLWICGKTCGKELDFRGNGEENFEDTEMNEYAKE
jgi:MoaA/NifB/PqqE/SkfB family radical SAM enzyme